jgi:hypothetical protein
VLQKVNQKLEYTRFQQSNYYVNHFSDTISYYKKTVFINKAIKTAKKEKAKVREIGFINTYTFLRQFVYSTTLP